GHGAREKPMPSRLGLALLGLTVGGATFLFSGVAAFLSIASLQDRAVISLQDRTVREARAPVAVVHYVRDGVSASVQLGKSGG
ncbi:MAG: hypothetical protein WCD67_21985, partial [Xanthobacteraceae bacterium]